MEGEGWRVMRARIAVFFLTFMAFLGSTLLFSMEPLVGRYLTLYFGSSAHVWLTTLMFFQAVLFLGYLYAHLVAPRIGRWHLAVLLLPILALPLKITGTPNANMPVLLILQTLLVNVALPFAAISTTAVVAQLWYFNHEKKKEPYFLYGASNAGSLLGLLAYTFLIEPFIGLKMQSTLWSVGYGLYYVVVAACWFMLTPGKPVESTAALPASDDLDRAALPVDEGTGSRSEGKVTTGRYLNWLAISAATSALLLAVTNFIAMEVGSFPFVWILPLGLYLCSFILTFRTAGGSMRFIKWLWVELLLIGFAMTFAGNTWLSMFGISIAFFLICLVAHRLLFYLRPAPAQLTAYYLMISFGGWVGGAFVSLVAPRIFNGLYEYPLILGALSLLFWINRQGFFWTGPYQYKRLPFLAHTILILAVVVPIVRGVHERWGDDDLVRHRNFYGVYRVFDRSLMEGKRTIRMMHNGATLHGAQLLDEKLCTLPITYYYRGGQITDCLERVPEAREVAVVGLGAGTIASYARPGDHYTYYEIDPDLERLCRKWFTYLENCEGDIRVIPGDGRLSLETSQEKLQYDLLIVDAFTGDGIPIHLLTTDAIRAYLKRVKPDGVILFHISNRFYDLRPVLKANTAELGLSCAYRTMDTDETETDEYYYLSSTYVAVTPSARTLDFLADRDWNVVGEDDGLEVVKPWSDDYMNILRVIDFKRIGEKMVEQIKDLGTDLRNLVKKPAPAPEE
ncbi:MAG TPA: fused MFS/spermidine synthase [Candidatus Sumerlaeota bacterium]|nr:fused MFS/spermidine synthase [Candidatus Sumerlaeota bacterium]